MNIEIKDEITPSLERIQRELSRRIVVTVTERELGMPGPHWPRPPWLQELHDRTAKLFGVSPESYTQYLAKLREQQREKKAREIAIAKAKVILDERVMRAYRGW